MTTSTGDEDQRIFTREEGLSHSDDENNADETTALLHNTEHSTNASRDINVPPEGHQTGRLQHILRLVKRDLGYALLFSIPIILLIPSLVFFIMTLNLRASLPSDSSPELIANLTHKVSRLSKSLNKCERSNTELNGLLQDEKQRVRVCRESERRLAARVELAESMLQKCQVEEEVLRGKLDSTKEDLGDCIDEKEGLKRQMESGVFVQFLEMVSKMGAGGDSWTCSDATQMWSYGYTSEEPPHPTITIQTWESDLDDTQHSAVPLVFPPSSFPLKSSRPITPTPSYQSMEKIFRINRKSPISGELDESLSVQHESYSSSPLSIRIVGYSVTSLNTSGNNGWWRITSIPTFAVEGGTIGFFAQAAKWYGSKAKYKVKVYWIDGTRKGF